MQFLVWSGILLAACSAPSLSRQGGASAAAPQCVVENLTLSAQEVDAIAALRRSVETGPLFTIPATSAGVASCRAGYTTGVIALDYSFRDGGWLRVKRDPRIEYNDQEARFELPLGENPIAVLTRAEMVAFGDKGCGIDWAESEKQPAEDDSRAVETIFRGDVCNCQARFRSNAAGRVIGLSLRSAC